MPIDIPAPGNDAILDALRAANERGALPTRLDTAGLRELAAQVRARSVFTARGANVEFVSALKELVEQMAAGEIGVPETRATLAETLRALGYTPEGGFPDTPAGEVPPAVRGTLQDLSSFRRLDLIARTQRDLSRGAGQQARGQQRERLEAFPAWELVRYIPAAEPRRWRARWQRAGGTLYQGRMIAPKGDPVWGELGASGNFPDALDVDHPPFAFTSGMGWDEINASEARELGVRSSTGESIDEWIDADEPAETMRGPLPAPEMGHSQADRDVLRRWIDDTSARPAGGTDPYEPGSYNFDDLLAQELAAADAAYGKGGSE